MRRCLRKRQIIDSFIDPNDKHEGTYWGIRTDIADYKLGDALQAPHDRTIELAAIPTACLLLDSAHRDDVSKPLLGPEVRPVGNEKSDR
jgi:NTE family protein